MIPEELEKGEMGKFARKIRCPDLCEGAAEIQNTFFEGVVRAMTDIISMAARREISRELYESCREDYPDLPDYNVAIGSPGKQDRF